MAIKHVVLSCAVMPVELKAIKGISVLSHDGNLLPCIQLTTAGNREAHYPIVTFSGESLADLKKKTLEHVEKIFEIMEESDEHGTTAPKG